MPCKDERSTYDNDGNRRDVKQLQERLDEVTQNLCYLCGTAETNALHILKGNKRLAKWWEDHQKADTKRVSEAMLGHIKAFKPMDSSEVARNFILLAKQEHPVSKFHEKWFHKLASEVMTKHSNEYKTKEALKKSINGKLSTEELEHVRVNGI